MSDLQFLQCSVKRFGDRNHNGEFRAVRWIQIKEEIVGVFEIGGARGPGIVVDATEAGQKEKGSAVVGGGIMDFLPFALGIHGDSFKPFRQAFAYVFLKESLAFDSVRIAAQNQRAVAEKRKDEVGDLVVVGQKVAFRVAGFWKVNLVQVAQPQAFAVKLDGNGFCATVEQLCFDLRVLADHSADDLGSANYGGSSTGRIGAGWGDL